MFDARIPLDDVNKRMDIDLASSVADTLGGYVYEQLGQVPSVNSQIADGDVEITVMSVSGRRIKRVKVASQPSPELQEEVEEGASEPAQEEKKSARSFNPLNLFLG